MIRRNHARDAAGDIERSAAKVTRAFDHGYHPNRIADYIREVELWCYHCRRALAEQAREKGHG